MKFLCDSLSIKSLSPTYSYSVDINVLITTIVDILMVSFNILKRKKIIELIQS